MTGSCGIQQAQAAGRGSSAEIHGMVREAMLGYAKLQCAKGGGHGPRDRDDNMLQDAG